MEQIYDYIFHFNPYDQMWYAVKRDEKELYFSDKSKCTSCIHSRDIQDLIKYLTIILK